MYVHRVAVVSGIPGRRPRLTEVTLIIAIVTIHMTRTRAAAAVTLSLTTTGHTVEIWREPAAVLTTTATTI